MLARRCCPAGDVLQTSAKTGLGLDQVLPAIIERVAPPKGQQDAPLRALLFDAFHDEYRWGDTACRGTTLIRHWRGPSEL